MPDQHLGAYLQDHLAGSVLALELLERLEKVHAGTDLAKTVAGLRDEITADQNELKTLMDRLGISAGTLRTVAGWFAEKAAQIKLRLDDTAGGDFRLLEAVEIVAIGIDGKRALWLALAEVSTVSPKLRGPDYDRLVQRAADQRRRIEAVRLDAARSALHQ